MIGVSREPRLLAEFGTVPSMLAAVAVLRREAYRDVETFTPFDVPEVDALLGTKRSRLGALAFAGGVAGLIVSYGIQWWANVHSYPLNAGGRPAHAVPAFVLATFEGTVLGSALFLFAGLLIVLRLPRLWAPVDEVEGFERASIDRFWIAMPTFASEQDRAHAAELLTEAGAIRTIARGSV